MKECVSHQAERRPHPKFIISSSLVFSPLTTSFRSSSPCTGVSVALEAGVRGRGERRELFSGREAAPVCSKNTAPTVQGEIPSMLLSWVNEYKFMICHTSQSSGNPFSESRGTAKTNFLYLSLRGLRFAW